MTAAVWAIAVMMNGAAPISMPFQLPGSVKAGLAAALRIVKITERNEDRPSVAAVHDPAHRAASLRIDRAFPVREHGVDQGPLIKRVALDDGADRVIMEDGDAIA